MRSAFVLFLALMLELTGLHAQVIIVPRPPVAPRPPAPPVVIVRPPRPHVPHHQRVIVHHDRSNRDYQRYQRERQRYEQQQARERAERERQRAEERARRERERNAYDRFTLHLGASANYAYGELGTAYTGYNPDLTDWQGNAFLGYRYDVTGRRKRKKGNLVGVWLSAGLHDQTALSSLFKSQGRFDTVDPASVNQFREWEAGFMLKEWFRISAGKGYQNFTNVGGENITLNYYTTTAGLALHFTKALDLTLNGTVLFGQDFQRYSFRPSVGVNYTFDFLRR